MPVIHTYSSTPIPANARESLKATYGNAIASVPGKSETWLMCLFDENVPTYHGGTNDAPAAYVTVDVFAREAVPRAAWNAMTPVICDALNDQLGVDPARIYIKYGETANFGWNGMNF
ncbi:MAG: hypothetical protein IKG18_05740 [Atopobiaceae bacterium]|nr:hypothetical protein [Atopobiaceae bacterium]